MARPRLMDQIMAGFEAAISGEAAEYTVGVPDPVKSYTKSDVAALRAHLRMTQAGFAELLNVSPKTVEAWESGTRVPSAAAARLLQVVENPDAFARVVHTRERAAEATARQVVSDPPG